MRLLEALSSGSQGILQIILADVPQFGLGLSLFLVLDLHETDLDHDLAIGTCELEGVGEEVHHNLDVPPGISMDVFEQLHFFD